MGMIMDGNRNMSGGVSYVVYSGVNNAYIAIFTMDMCIWKSEIAFWLNLWKFLNVNFASKNITISSHFLANH
jgi:hypothetical protein